MRMFLRGRPVTMHMPDQKRDSYRLDHKGTLPEQKLKLQWVYLSVTDKQRIVLQGIQGCIHYEPNGKQTGWNLPELFQYKLVFVAFVPQFDRVGVRITPQMRQGKLVGDNGYRSIFKQ